MFYVEKKYLTLVQDWSSKAKVPSPQNSCDHEFKS